MSEYPKIETLFERNEKFIVDPAKLKKGVLGTINQWLVTEKIDGMNIRVDGNNKVGPLNFFGRTDKANLPGDLLNYLYKTFDPVKLAECGLLGEQFTLYGEGYGTGIQKGGGYRADKAFILFDAMVDGHWMEWEELVVLAQTLNIQIVPLIGRMTLDEIVEMVKEGKQSFVAMANGGKGCQSEGIVAKPIETLFDRYGNRIIIKLKTKDFGK